MKALFTVNTTGFTPTQRTDVLEALSNALRNEFPAYWISEMVATDFLTALVVEGRDDNAPRPAHLNGWGLGSLTIKLLA